MIQRALEVGMLGDVDDVGQQLVGAFYNPSLLLGIPLAIAGAVFMSLGAQYQSQGVRKVERISGATADTGLRAGHLLRLLTRPSWVIGTILLGVAIVCQLSALAVAPLIVVQPLGAVSLVITTLLNAQISGHTPTRKSLTSIGLCVGGIFLFVIVAALFAVEHPITQIELYTVLVILLLVIILLVVAWLMLRQKMGALFYISAAGVLYGFVATLAKAVIGRIAQGDFWDWLTIVCVIALIAAAAAGGYFVQTAYSSGPPDLVIAGLTVIDPIVAVVIGALVLGEASKAPWWAIIIFVVAGACAAYGVFLLARHHPQVVSESQELGIARGRDEGIDRAARETGEPLAAPGETALDQLRAMRDPDDLLDRRLPPEEDPDAAR